MWRNYLNTAIRNLWKQKYYTLINVLGLALGLACFLFILAYVKDELSYDRYHEKADRIYRADFKGHIFGQEFDLTEVGDPFGPTVLESYPEVVQQARLRDHGSYLVRYENNSYREDEVVFADSTFFQVFTFPLLKGDPQMALAEPGAVVITPAVAKKYFGDEDPIGKTLVLDNEHNHRVTGIMEEMPKNTHFYYNMLLSMPSLEESRSNQWVSNNFHTYLVLKEGADPKALQSKFPQIIETHIGRQLEQYDAHIFCREDQIGEETLRFLKLFERVYNDFGLSDIAYKLATRPDMRAGTDETWDRAEKALADALTAAGMQFEIAEGEGAFYGPKLEFHLTDAIGRTWQCGTFQLDYVLPERLDAEYTGSDGAKHRPVMLHRAVFGTFERFTGILIENYAGAFPMWLSPVQVVVAAITDAANDYAEEGAAALRKAGLRVETDLRNEKINYKVREHSLQKVPVIAVVGGRESEERTLALRRLGSNAQEMMSLDEACVKLAHEGLAPDLKA